MFLFVFCLLFFIVYGRFLELNRFYDFILIHKLNSALCNSNSGLGYKLGYKLKHLSWKTHITMVTGKLSKINGISNRLKYIYPTHILLTIYKSLFVLYINYGSLVWGQNFNSISKLQKKVIRTVTRSNYIAHSEPLLKELNMLNVKDLMDLNLIKFLHKLYDNKLPIYFNEYMPYLEARETKYNLRPHPLPVPRVAHAFAESCLL